MTDFPIRLNAPTPAWWWPKINGTLITSGHCVNCKVTLINKYPGNLLFPATISIFYENDLCTFLGSCSLSQILRRRRRPLGPFVSGGKNKPNWADKRDGGGKARQAQVGMARCVIVTNGRRHDTTWTLRRGPRRLVHVRSSCWRWGSPIRWSGSPSTTCLASLQKTWPQFYRMKVNRTNGTDTQRCICIGHYFPVGPLRCPSRGCDAMRWMEVAGVPNCVISLCAPTHIDTTTTTLTPSTL